MTAFDDGLWDRLVADHAADDLTLAEPARATSRRPLAVGGSVTTLAAVGVGALLAFNAATNAPPAYALTENTDGSITVTINDLATAVPELNQRFAALGIDETVVPVQAGCANASGFPLFASPQSHMTDTITLVPGRKYLQPGYTGILAAEQLPSGEVAMAMGAVLPPVPTCFSSQAYQLTPDGTSTNGIPRYDITPVS